MSGDVGEGFRPPVPADSASEWRTPQVLPQRKPNRLSSAVYRGGGAFFLTVCVSGTRRPFSSGRIVGSALEALKKAADQFGIEAIEYCFMPDHLHLLVVAPQKVDIMTFMERFKQMSGFACNRLLRSAGRFWQRSYYDHVLRRSEDIEAVTEYIRGNPLRAGLVKDAQDYPFSGSLLERREV